MDLKFHTFRIHAPLDPSEAFIEMDGKRIERVVKIEFSISASDLPTLTLTVEGVVEIDGEFTSADLLSVRNGMT
jgi:hypothetical protein